MNEASFKFIKADEEFHTLAFNLAKDFAKIIDKNQDQYRKIGNNPTPVKFFSSVCLAMAYIYENLDEDPMKPLFCTKYYLEESLKNTGEEK